MEHRPLETHWWNLPLVVTASTVAAGCGPLVTPDGQTNTDAMTDSSPQPTGTTVGTCSNSNECGAGYECIDGTCVRTDDCASGGCCYGTGCCDVYCCTGDCDYSACLSDSDCGPYGFCEGIGLDTYCIYTQPLGECDGDFAIEVLSLPVPVGDLLISLSYVEVDGDPGEELVLGRIGSAELHPGPGEMYVELPVPPGSSIRDTISGDFDGDGDGDLVLTTDMGELLLLINEGASTFTLAQQLAVNPPISGLEPVDWNGDGIVDVLTRADTGDLIVRTIEAPGVFGPSHALPGVYASSLAVTDYGGDPYGDLVVQTLEDAEVYLGGAAGDVMLDAVLSGEQRGIRQVFAGPIVGTAPYEVVGYTPLYDGWQLLELWTGGSDSPQLYSLPNEVWYAVSGDFDGNGSTDLVTVQDATLYYVRSQAEAGVPSFSCYIPYFVGGTVGNFAMGDFDGNGRADMTVSSSNDVSILLSQ